MSVCLCLCVCVLASLWMSVFVTNIWTPGVCCVRKGSLSADLMQVRGHAAHSHTLGVEAASSAAPSVFFFCAVSSSSNGACLTALGHDPTKRLDALQQGRPVGAGKSLVIRGGSQAYLRFTIVNRRYAWLPPCLPLVLQLSFTLCGQSSFLTFFCEKCEKEDTFLWERRHSRPSDFLSCKVESKEMELELELLKLSRLSRTNGNKTIQALPGFLILHLHLCAFRLCSSR